MVVVGIVVAAVAVLRGGVPHEERNRTVAAFRAGEYESNDGERHLFAC